MRPLACVLLAAVVLAGCSAGSSESAPPASLPTGAGFNATREHPRSGMHDEWPANGTVTLGGAAPLRQEVGVTLSPGTVQVVFTVRFDSGTVSFFRADLDGCVLEVPGPAPATGQALSKDCGAMEGPQTLALEQSVGVVTVTYGVAARVWNWTPAR